MATFGCACLAIASFQRCWGLRLPQTRPVTLTRAVEWLLCFSRFTISWLWRRPCPRWQEASPPCTPPTRSRVRHRRPWARRGQAGSWQRALGKNSTAACVLEPTRMARRCGPSGLARGPTPGHASSSSALGLSSSSALGLSSSLGVGLSSSSALGLGLSSSLVPCRLPVAPVPASLAWCLFSALPRRGPARFLPLQDQVPARFSPAAMRHCVRFLHPAGRWQAGSAQRPSEGSMAVSFSPTERGGPPPCSRPPPPWPGTCKHHGNLARWRRGGGGWGGGGGLEEEEEEEEG